MDEVQDSELCLAALFAVKERNYLSQVHGDYFRDLSFNYSEYLRTDKWPERPEGLQIIEPASEAELARM